MVRTLGRHDGRSFYPASHTANRYLTVSTFNLGLFAIMKSGNAISNLAPPFYSTEVHHPWAIDKYQLGSEEGGIIIRSQLSGSSRYLPTCAAGPANSLS